MKENELKTIQTVIFLLDGMKEMTILELHLAPYLKKAKEIVRILENSP